MYLNSLFYFLIQCSEKNWYLLDKILSTYVFIVLIVIYFYSFILMTKKNFCDGIGERQMVKLEKK